LLDDMVAVNIGATSIAQIFRDGTEVWPKTPVTLASSSTIWDKVVLTWTAPTVGASDYILKRDGAQIYSGTALTFTDTLRLQSTAYTYTLEAYKGAVKQSTATKAQTTPAHGDLGLGYSQLAWSSALLSWTDTTQGSIDKYSVYKSDATWVEDSTSAADKSAAVGLVASTAYSYTVRAYRSGVEVGPRDTVSFTSPARPTVQKTFESSRAQYASYHENGSNRGSAELYYGWFSTNWGVQKSQARWDFPADMRNCISIDSIQLRWWNQHHFLISGGVVGMSVHHNTNLGGSYGGSTGSIRITSTTGSAVNWAAPRNGWINGTEWFDQNTTFTDRMTVREEFRAAGAQGFELRTNQGGSQNGYGYASNDVIIKVVYTVYS